MKIKWKSEEIGERKELRNYILIRPQCKYSQVLLRVSLVQQPTFNTTDIPSIVLQIQNKKVSSTSIFTLNSQRNFNITPTLFRIISTVAKSHQCIDVNITKFYWSQWCFFLKGKGIFMNINTHIHIYAQIYYMHACAHSYVYTYICKYTSNFDIKQFLSRFKFRFIYFL